MKYFAILRDSLREAIDAKIFYVLTGLSALLTLVAFSLTFNPKPGGDFWKIATATLTLDPAKAKDKKNLERIIFEAAHGGLRLRVFEFIAARPLNGAAEGPWTKYEVLVRERADKNPKEGESKQQAFDSTVNEIKNKFGTMGDVQIVKALHVVRPKAEDPDLPKGALPEDGYYVISTEPTNLTVHWWPHEIGLFFGALPLGTAPLAFQLLIILGGIINFFGATLAVLISVIITGFFIPNMLRKGTIDLLLVKPIHRPALLIYKYLGGLLFILINTAVAVLGMWLALGLKSGIWVNNFLLTIFAVTFFFAILYAVSTLFAVLTRSVVASILVTCGVWFALFIIGLLHSNLANERSIEEANNTPVEQRRDSSLFWQSVSAVHFVLPRTKDLDQLMNELLVADLLAGEQQDLMQKDKQSITWGESLTVSFAFIAVMLGASCWFFSRKDF